MTGRTTDYWRQLDAISASGSLQELYDAARTALHSAGFGAAYFLIPVTADARVGRTLTNLGFPDDWERAYRGGLDLIDPMPMAAVSHAMPVRWSALAREVRGGGGVDEFWHAMRSLGLDDGLAIACFGPQARQGFAGVGLPLSEQSFSPGNLRKAHAATQLTFQRICELGLPEPTEMPALSQRELEVIRWISEGKSNAVIASILDISKSSVDIYVKRIFGKLDVHDRTTASVRALALGLISHSDDARTRKLIKKREKA